MLGRKGFRFFAGPACSPLYLPELCSRHKLMFLDDIYNHKTPPGMLMSSYKSVTMPEQLVRLWCHETKRVFEDRLINAEDHAWFKQLLQGIVKDNFQMEWDDVVPQVRKREPRKVVSIADVNKARAQP